MANDTVVPLIPSRKKPGKAPSGKALTGADRTKAYRERQKLRGKRLAFVDVTPLLPAPPVESQGTSADKCGQVRDLSFTSSRLLCPETALTLAAWASAAVGICMNGWYARTLGSSDIAGVLFLAIGVVADTAALFLPTCCARIAAKGQRSTAAIGWVVWLAAFVFAVCAGLGFASVNVADVTASRASRVTPAVTAAQNALADAMKSRDQECKGGVGKFCREREAAVAQTRGMLETALRSTENLADPQVAAATHAVIWLSGGYIKPSADDFAMLRLVLLALLPQIGGVLLMIGRGAR